MTIKFSRLTLAIIASATLNWAQAIEGCPSLGTINSEFSWKNLHELGKVGATRIGGQLYRLVGYNETKSSFEDKLLSTPEDINNAFDTEKYGAGASANIQVHTRYLNKKNSSLKSCAYIVTVYNPMAKGDSKLGGATDRVIAFEPYSQAPAQTNRPAAEKTR